jgi:hypothetical protein
LPFEEEICSMELVYYLFLNYSTLQNQEGVCAISYWYREKGYEDGVRELHIRESECRQHTAMFYLANMQYFLFLSMAT